MQHNSLITLHLKGGPIAYCRAGGQMRNHARRLLILSEHKKGRFLIRKIGSRQLEALFVLLHCAWVHGRFHWGSVALGRCHLLPA